MSGVNNCSRLYAIALEGERQQVIADWRWDLGPGGRRKPETDGSATGGIVEFLLNRNSVRGVSGVAGEAIAREGALRSLQPWPHDRVANPPHIAAKSEKLFLRGLRGHAVKDRQRTPVGAQRPARRALVWA